MPSKTITYPEHLCCLLVFSTVLDSAVENIVVTKIKVIIFQDILFICLKTFTYHLSSELNETFHFSWRKNTSIIFCRQYFWKLHSWWYFHLTFESKEPHKSYIKGIYFIDISCSFPIDTITKDIFDLFESSWVGNATKGKLIMNMYWVHFDDSRNSRRYDTGHVVGLGPGHGSHYIQIWTQNTFTLGHTIMDNCIINKWFTTYIHI